MRLAGLVAFSVILAGFVVHGTDVAGFHGGATPAAQRSAYPDAVGDLQAFEESVGVVKWDAKSAKASKPKTTAPPVKKKSQSAPESAKVGAALQSAFVPKGNAGHPSSSEGLSARHAAKNAVDSLEGFEKSMEEATTPNIVASHEVKDHSVPQPRSHSVLSETSKVKQDSTIIPTRPNTGSTPTSSEIHHAERSAARASNDAIDDLSHFEKAVSKSKHSSKQVSVPTKKVVPASSPMAMERIASKKELVLANSLVDWMQHDHMGDKCANEFERQQCGHLYCGTNNTCQYCFADAHCHSPRYRCFGPDKSTCTGKKCECHHKNLFPMVGADFEAMGLAFVATALAASGGIGGGGLLVPLFVLVEDFEADLASPLSSATLTGGAIVGYLMLCGRWHPHFPSVERPLIDYDTVLMLLPSLLTGTMMGTILDKILPIWLIITLLFLLLGVSTVRTFQTAMSKLEQEWGDAEVPLQGKHDKDADLDDDNGKEEGDVQLHIEGTRFPKQTLAMIICFWFFVFFIALLKGGSGTPSILPFVSCNNTGYWAIQLFCWVCMFIVFIFIRKQVLKSDIKTFVDGDVDWNYRNSITIPLICLPCGLCAGLLGVGGGMVVAPLLVELGAQNEIIRATSTFTVLITASSSATQFVLMGKLPPFYALFFAMVGGLGTCLGQWAVERVIKRFRSTSVIVFGIAGVIFMSTCAIGYTGIRALVRIAEIGGNIGLRNLCD